MKIEVIYSQWGTDALVLPGGLHDVSLTESLAPLVAGAVAAGSLILIEATDEEAALLAGHVQSQQDGEDAYAKAVESGDWGHGNLTQFVNDRETMLALHDDPDSDVTLSDEQVEAVTSDLEQGRATLDEWYRAHPDRKVES